MRIKSTLLIFLVSAIMLSTIATPYSIVLNQPFPHYGNTVNFTIVYPKEADQRIGKQQMFQPSLSVDCYQNNMRVFSRIVIMASKTNNGDGTFTGITGPVTLGGTFDNFSWTNGGAMCYATSYYFKTKSLIAVTIAQITFEVLP